jgi:hypothetical protein
VRDRASRSGCRRHRRLRPLNGLGFLLRDNGPSVHLDRSGGRRSRSGVAIAVAVAAGVGFRLAGSKQVFEKV